MATCIFLPLLVIAETRHLLIASAVLDTSTFFFFFTLFCHFILLPGIKMFTIRHILPFTCVFFKPPVLLIHIRKTPESLQSREENAKIPTEWDRL